MYDIDSFTAIINPPECAILAIGKIEKTPVVRDDTVMIRPIMTMSLTYDHRVVDGALAAQFLQRIKQILQNPWLLIYGMSINNWLYYFPSRIDQTRQSFGKESH
jgi:pyruvate dehydrogenase E2 component (dihydrolipoamide acetyltransferase)